MVNPSGIHKLRTPREEKWFMTDSGVDEVVSLNPEGPQQVQAQQVHFWSTLSPVLSDNTHRSGHQWSITPVPGAERPNMYYVYLHNKENGKRTALVQQHRHGAHHHNRDHHTHDECCLPQGSVILSARHVDEWEITPLVKDVPADHRGKAFVFRVATDAPGKEWCIGTDGSKLAIKPFSVESGEERPYWLVEDSKFAESTK
ncbi:hypothetical protein EST38_g1398 [Candolleomyces aberdarensis]|uniref:Uncharacterized protein n=1 Tax=Candolleomyces aberdarensis TaxID=2316362 RepID=A0A4Q2DXI9_9AGAR|nr:hypothetical protein EST38_g1398 [Candolleomyces aberdarensis]